MIRWSDLTLSFLRWQGAEADGRRPRTYAAAICLKCGRVMIRQQPDKSYHRTHADAQAGAHPLQNCPKCGTPLYSRNRIN